MTPSLPSAATGADSEATQSVAEMRASTKWIVSAAAGVGAVLVGGLRLSDLTRLGIGPPGALGEHKARLAMGAVAVAAVVLALYHVVKIIMSAAQVFTVPYHDLDNLIDELTDLDKKAVDRGTPLGARAGWESDQRLTRDVRAAMVHLRSLGASEPKKVYGLNKSLARAVQQLQRGQPSVRAMGQDWTDINAVRGELETVDAAIGKALAAVNEVEVADRYSKLTSRVARSGVGIVVGVIVFVAVFAVAGDSPTAVTRPLPATVYLQPGTKAQELGLGSACTRRVFTGAAVAGTLERPQVAIRPADENCQASLVTISHHQATVVYDR